jgi:hypothetical protein
MRSTWVADHQPPPCQPQRVGFDHRPVRRIRELESAHGIEADNTNPVGNQRVFAALRG